jgi:hypothetical protein
MVSNIISGGCKAGKKEITRLYSNPPVAKRDVQRAGYLALLHIPFWA